MVSGPGLVSTRETHAPNTLPSLGVGFTADFLKLTRDLRARRVPSSEYSGISSSDCDLDHRIKVLRILGKCHDRRTVRQDPPVDGGGTS